MRTANTLQAFTLPRHVSEDIVLEVYFIREYATIFLMSGTMIHSTRPQNLDRSMKLQTGTVFGLGGPATEHELRQAVVTFSSGKRGCPGQSLAVSTIFLYIIRALQELEIRPPSSGMLADRFTLIHTWYH